MRLSCMITKLLRHLHTSSTLPHAFSKFVGSQTSPAKSRLTRSPVKSLPSPAQSPVKFAPKSVNVIVRMAPTSGKEPDIEYRNPDEISLGSSEDVEKAGPDSDPQLLIESIDDYNGPTLHPDATSSPSNSTLPKQDRKPRQATAPKTTGKSEKKKTTEAKKASGASSSKVKKQAKTKKTNKQKEMIPLETVKNTRSSRGEVDLGFDALDALLKRRRLENKKKRS